MKKIISAVLVLTMMLALLSGCGDNSASENNVETSDLYEQVMARFDGELEEGAVIKVLENDTAVELGYVDQLINAFNEAYKDKGISAERMNIDQYSDLATDGPYGYGPDVWYQANDILMKYADNQHLLPLPIYDMECYEQIPQNAWNAYAHRYKRRDLLLWHSAKCPVRYALLYRIHAPGKLGNRVGYQ